VASGAVYNVRSWFKKVGTVAVARLHRAAQCARWYGRTGGTAGTVAPGPSTGGAHCASLCAALAGSNALVRVRWGRGGWKGD